MADNQTCLECGAAVPTNAPAGVCPKCLLKAGLAGVGNADQLEPTPDQQPYAATTPQHVGAARSGGFVPLEPDVLARLFPNLEILSLLGHGGMGAVYKARQSRLDRLVALKIIRPESADDPMFTVRFDREAKILARLNHPNIVGVFDFGDVEYTADDGTRTVLYYFLMEYVDGVNLRRLIQSGHTESAQALPIVMQVCEALQYAHNQGVVHRDIKPENILLDTNGRVKIADFGLAKFGREAHDLQLTGTQQVLGTVQYMAPEQIAQSKTVDHRADIYSMGVVFYELLTGEIPLGAFEPPSRRASVDRRLDDVVMKALASDPNHRFQNASDVGNQISSISSTDMAPDTAADQAHWPGPSTIIEDKGAAFVAGVNKFFSPEESEDDLDLGKTGVTLTLAQVQSDDLPDVCVVCGQATRRRLGREFQHLSDQYAWLMVLLFIFFFPAGIVAAIVLTRRVRTSLPVCAKHSSHWSRMVWFASLGWLNIIAGAAIGIWLTDFNIADGRDIATLLGCLLAGIALYVIPLVYLGSTRVAVAEITDTSITFKRVAVRFARAVAQRKS